MDQFTGPNGSVVLKDIKGNSSFHIHSNEAMQVTKVDLSRISPAWQPIILSIYGITLLASLALNIVTIIVISSSYRKRVLKAWLINLCISDSLASFCSTVFLLTDYMYGYWIFPNWLCPVARSSSVIFTSASVATLTSIAIDRYMAIVKQTQFRLWFKRRIHMVAAIWSISVIISLPEAMFFEAHRPEGYTVYFCINTKGKLVLHLYTIFFYLITFIGPLIVLIYLGFKMIKSLRNHNVPGNENLNWGPNMHLTRLRVTRGLAVVVISFMLTWAPLQTLSLTYYLCQSYFEQLTTESMISRLMYILYLVFHWLSVSYSVLNPLIYCFMSLEFRSDLTGVLSRRKSKACGRNYPTTYSRTYANGNSSQARSSYPNYSTNRARSPSIANHIAKLNLTILLQKECPNTTPTCDQISPINSNDEEREDNDPIVWPEVEIVSQISQSKTNLISTQTEWTTTKNPDTFVQINKTSVMV